MEGGGSEKCHNDVSCSKYRYVMLPLMNKFNTTAAKWSK